MNISKHLRAGRGLALLSCFAIVACVAIGCGGGGGGNSPSATATPTPRNTATPTPNNTATPGNTPTPGAPPSLPFDLRGRVLLNGTGQSGAVVSVIGDTNSVTPIDRTTSGAGGYYSFFLGSGTYRVRATLGTRTVSRVVVVPPGGQKVDNVNFNL